MSYQINNINKGIEIFKIYISILKLKSKITKMFTRWTQQ